MFSNSIFEIDQKLTQFQKTGYPSRLGVVQTHHLQRQKDRRAAEAVTMRAFRAARSRQAVAALLLGLSHALSRLAQRVAPQPATQYQV